MPALFKATYMDMKLAPAHTAVLNEHKLQGLADENHPTLAETDLAPPNLPSPAGLFSNQTVGKPGVQRSIHLPSQLGSDVGNGFTTDTQAEEKAHMDIIISGVADRVLRESPLDHLRISPHQLDNGNSTTLEFPDWNLERCPHL